MAQTDTRMAVIMPRKVFSDLFRHRHVKYYVRSQDCTLISVIERKRVAARWKKVFKYDFKHTPSEVAFLGPVFIGHSFACDSSTLQDNIL